MHTAPGVVHEFDVFQYPPSGNWICTVLRDGEPWFAAADIAATLGYRDAHHGLRTVEPTDRGTYRLDTPDGPRDLAIVNESGLYRMIINARRPDAVGFQLWIVRDVLPTLRGAVRYAVPAEPPLPKSYSQALRELASTVERAEAAEASLAEVAPAAAAWRVLASAEGDYSVREAAFILNRDPAIETGQGRLFRALREFGLIDEDNIPYARHATHVRLRATSYEHPRTGDQIATEQVRLTATGIRYLHRRLGGTGQPAFADLLREVRALPAASA